MRHKKRKKRKNEKRTNTDKTDSSEERNVHNIFREQYVEKSRIYIEIHGIDIEVESFDRRSREPPNKFCP